MENNDFRVLNGNCLDLLDTLKDNSIDAIITDPPYELGFMGKKWDSTGIAYNVELWKKCLRVLKPNGYLLAFGGSRTFHRIAVAIEDAGFEIRDTLMWLYGSGFPKSLNIGKSIESLILNGTANTQGFRHLEGEKVERGNYGYAKVAYEQGARPNDYNELDDQRLGKLNPQTEEGKKWNGWGTALKPAFEPIIMARKPTKLSIAENCLKYGVGGLNIDECRIYGETINCHDAPKGTFAGKVQTIPKFGSGKEGVSNLHSKDAERIEYIQHEGRFPANIITDGSEEVASGFPNNKSNEKQPNYEKSNCDAIVGFSNYKMKSGYHYGDEGSAMRYFYTAKASKKDRDDGLFDFENVRASEITGRKEHSKGLEMEGGKQNPYAGKSSPNNRNSHPTVKPCELMQYLIRLVSPKGATILDIFNGSGSTGKAVAFENRERDANYKYIGFELEKDYCEISLARIDYALNKYKYDEIEYDREMQKNGQLSLFEL